MKKMYNPSASAAVALQVHKNALPGPLTPAGMSRKVSGEEIERIRAKFEAEKQERIEAAQAKRARKAAKRLKLSTGEHQ